MRLPSERDALMAFCRERALAVNLDDGRLLCRILGAKPFYAWASDRSITPHLAMSGFFEPDLTCWLIANVQPGWTWADIGANYGYIAVLLAELTHNARGVAFEPIPEAYWCLRDNLKVNDCRNVLAHRHAIGPHPDEEKRTIRVSYEFLGGSSLEPSPFVSEYECVDISATVRPFRETVDLLKIDAEGMDLAIVNALDPKPPRVICEYGSAWRNDADLERMFREWRVRGIGLGGELFDTSLDDVRECDMLNLYLEPV